MKSTNTEFTDAKRRATVKRSTEKPCSPFVSVSSVLALLSYQKSEACALLFRGSADLEGRLSSRPEGLHYTAMKSALVVVEENAQGSVSALEDVVAPI